MPLLFCASACAAVRGERIETAIRQPDAVTLAGDPGRSSNDLGRAAFSFTATDLFTRAVVSGRVLYDHGPVIVTFVSPQCEISTEQAPEINDAVASSPDITYLFVHSGGTIPTYAAWIEAADLFHENVFHLDDSDLDLWNRFGIEVQPTTVIADRAGTVRVASGGLGHEGFTAAALLASSTSVVRSTS